MFFFRVSVCWLLGLRDLESSGPSKRTAYQSYGVHFCCHSRDEKNCLFLLILGLYTLFLLLHVLRLPSLGFETAFIKPIVCKGCERLAWVCRLKRSCLLTVVMKVTWFPTAVRSLQSPGADGGWRRGGQHSSKRDWSSCAVFW